MSNKALKQTGLKETALKQTVLEQKKTSQGLETLAAHIEQSGDSQQSVANKQAMDNQQRRTIPPLTQWHPEYCADMDLLIKANGEWWHEGRQITRQSLVDLFSTILWCEGSDEATQYFLKTPVEKMRIQVEDVPFLMTQVNEVEKQGLLYLEFVSSTGDVVYLTEDNPIEMRPYYHQTHGHTGEQSHTEEQSRSDEQSHAQPTQDRSPEYRPYIQVRFGMRGLISRNVFMHLVSLGELSEHNGETQLSLQSGGKRYHLSVPS